MSKREELLITALELFAADGYENVGIQRIVEAVGVTKPTLYHYFGSKKGLLIGILDYFFEPFLIELRKSTEYNGDLVFTLERVVKLYFNFAEKTGNFYRFVLSLNFSSENSEARQTIHVYGERQFLIIMEMFEKAAIDNGNMAGRSKRYTMTFQGMIHTYITMFYYGHTTLTDKNVFESTHQFMHGILS